jgi:hypothetical protein
LICRIAHRRRDVHQIPAGGERIDPGGLRFIAGSHQHRQRIRRRARPVLRHRWRSDVHQRYDAHRLSRCAHRAIDLHHHHALSGDLRRDNPLDARQLRAGQVNRA